jgi:hypothetical protein
MGLRETRNAPVSPLAQFVSASTNTITPACSRAVTVYSHFLTNITEITKLPTGIGVNTENKVNKLSPLQFQI